MAADDMKVLEALLADGALTADQARRVRTQLARGTALLEALQKTPLVDPLQLTRAQQKAGAIPVGGAQARADLAAATLGSIESSDDDTINDLLPRKAAEPPRRPKIPSLDPEPAAAEPPRRPRIPSLDPEPGAADAPRRPRIPSLDPEPRAPAARPAAPATAEDWDRRLQEAMRARQGAAAPALAAEREPAPPAASPAPLPTAAGVSRRLELPGPAESYQRGDGQKLRYDLANDEGINLIKELNGLLVELIDLEGRGLEIDATSLREGEVRFFASGGALSMNRRLEGDKALKLINRLKVMARIEPWRKDSPRGAFEVRHFAARRMIHLQITSRGPESELATVYLIAGPPAGM